MTPGSAHRAAAPDGSGRVAVVTGAGRGIGRATALALAARGDRVLAVARTELELRSLAAEAPIHYLVQSVATAEGCAAIVEHAHQTLGPIEILVNNAGVGSAGEAPIWEMDSELWHEKLAVNLHAPFELTRLAARDMVEGGFGRIVTVSSTAGEVGGPRMAAYCAAKAGVLGLTRAVATDVAPYGVTCNAVLPGWVRTEMAERSAEREAERRGVTVEQVWGPRRRVPGGPRRAGRGGGGRHRLPDQRGGERNQRRDRDRRARRALVTAPAWGTPAHHPLPA